MVVPKISHLSRVCRKSINTRKNKAKVPKKQSPKLKVSRNTSKKMSSRIDPLPRAKTWDPKNQACNVVYAICMSEARKGTLADAKNIISKIRDSPALEMTTLELVIRAMSKAIMDIYDDAGAIGEIENETENQCFDRVAVELTAMEEAKAYFEKMAKF
jgi:hypothetical protein